MKAEKGVACCLVTERQTLSDALAHERISGPDQHVDGASAHVWPARTPSSTATRSGSSSRCRAGGQSPDC